jgi:hypothetical protein
VIDRSAKLALLVACMALGLSPLAVQAQQREKESKTGESKAVNSRKDERKKEKNQSAERGGTKPVDPSSTDKEGSKKNPNENKSGDRKDNDKEPAKKGSPKKEKQRFDNKDSGTATNKDRQAVSPEREEAVMAFVKLNHPELAQLLKHLKENQPKEYERAIRELFRASDRLTQIHDRDRAQYDLEVQLWKTQSRVQLLTARLKMGESEELKKQLQDLLGEQIDNRAALLRHERQKVATRLSRIDSDLQRLENDRQKVIDKQLQTLTGAAVSKTNAAARSATRRAAKEVETEAGQDTGKEAGKGSAASSDSASGLKTAD